MTRELQMTANKKTIVAQSGMFLLIAYNKGLSEILKHWLWYFLLDLILIRFTLNLVFFVQLKFSSSYFKVKRRYEQDIVGLFFPFTSKKTSSATSLLLFLKLCIYSWFTVSVLFQFVEGSQLKCFHNSYLNVCTLFKTFHFFENNLCLQLQARFFHKFCHRSSISLSFT